jgi:hypothetical protein
MENLWQRLKPSQKARILANKDNVPYLVDNVKNELKRKKFWDDLDVSTVRQVLSFTHNSVLDISMNDVYWGASLLTNEK